MKLKRLLTLAGFLGLIALHANAQTIVPIWDLPPGGPMANGDVVGADRNGTTYGVVVTLSPSAYVDTTIASNITRGIISGARLPVPTTATLGGIKSVTCPSTYFLYGVDGTGTPLCGNFSSTLPTLADGKIWIGNSSGVPTAQSISGDGTLSDTGVLQISTVNGLNPFNATNLTSGTIPAARLPATTVTPGSYTSANITVGADGRITAAANGNGGGITALTGDVSATGPGSALATLATVNSTVGSFGDAGHVATFTVNGKGLVTVSSQVAITPAAIGAPTTTGTGASGTWGINISGNAATVTTNANLTGDVISTGNVTSIAATTVTGKAITGFSASAGTVTATDSILTALDKIVGNINNLVSGVSSVFGRTGIVTAQSGDYTVSQVTGAAPIASPTFTGMVTGTFSGNLTGDVTGNASTVTTNANLTGAVTSSGNATSLGSFSSANLISALTDETGSGSAVFAGSPTLTGTVNGSASIWSGSNTALNFVASGTGADTIPVGTTGERPSPIEGMIRDSTSLHALEAYVNGAWTTLSSAVGTVTNISVVTANGVSGSVANSTTTPAITLTLGAITPTSVNGLTISTSTGTLAIANSKTLTDNNTLTFSGTDSSSVNFGTGGTVLYGNQTITLSGDTTGSGTTAITTTTAKVDGVSYPASPSTNTVPVVTGVNTVTYEVVPNAALANSSMTIGGQGISLGGTTTNQGNGGKIQLSTGATTTNDCAKFDANGNVIDAGAACGTAGGVTSWTGDGSLFTNSASTGAVTATLGTQTKNTFLAGPTTGSAAAPGFRAIVNADIPAPTTSALGGIQASAGATSNQYMTYVDISGIQHTAQPSVSNLSDGSTGTGAVVLANSPTISGTLSATTVTAAATVSGTRMIVTSATTPSLGLYAPVGGTTFGLSANSQPVIEGAGVSSAVDYFLFTNSAAGNPATESLAVAGTDTNVNMNLQSKGSGTVQINGVPVSGGAIDQVNTAFIRTHEVGSLTVPDQEIMNGQICRTNKPNIFTKGQTLNYPNASGTVFLETAPSGYVGSLMTLSVGGTTQFSVSQNGTTINSAQYVCNGSGREFVLNNSGHISMGNLGGLAWNNSSNAGGGTEVAGIWYDGTNIDIGNATQGDFSGSIKATSFNQAGTAYLSAKFVNAMTASAVMSNFGGL